MPSQSVTYNTVGTFVKTLPSGVTAVWASGTASGAGASAATSQGGGGGNAGGGGGGGESIDNMLIPCPLGTATVVIGAAGTGGVFGGAVPANGGDCSVNGIVLLGGTASRTVAPLVANANAFAGGSGGGASGIAGIGGIASPAALPTPGTVNGRHTGGPGGGSGASALNPAQAGASAPGNPDRSVPGAATTHGGGGGANTRYGKGGDGGTTGTVGTTGVGQGSGGGGAGTDPIASPGKDGVCGQISLSWTVK